MFQSLSGFGEILSTSSMYEADNTYTITVQPNSALQKWESTIESALKGGFAGRYFDILNVSRTLGSGRFAITVKPKKQLKYSSGNMFVIQDFNNAGMDKAEIIQVESGKESTQSGGFKQVIPEAAGAIGQVASRTITAAATPLLPWLLVAGVIASVVFFGVKPYLEEKAKSYVR